MCECTFKWEYPEKEKTGWIQHGYEPTISIMTCVRRLWGCEGGDHNWYQQIRQNKCFQHPMVKTMCPTYNHQMFKTLRDGEVFLTLNQQPDGWGAQNDRSVG